MGVFFYAVNIIPLVRINRDFFGFISVDIQKLDPCLDALKFWRVDLDPYRLDGLG